MPLNRYHTLPEPLLFEEAIVSEWWATAIRITYNGWYAVQNKFCGPYETSPELLLRDLDNPVVVDPWKERSLIVGYVARS